MSSELSNYWGASKPHHCFKTYGYFSEGIYFAIGGVAIGKGLRLQPVQQAYFRRPWIQRVCPESLLDQNWLKQGGGLFNPIYTLHLIFSILHLNSLNV